MDISVSAALALKHTSPILVNALLTKFKDFPLVEFEDTLKRAWEKKEGFERIEGQKET